MNSKHLKYVISMAVCMALAPVGLRGQVPGMTLDQADTPSGTQYVFSNYYSFWQSYTAGTNGHLGAVDVVVYSTGGAAWTATFSIYEGNRVLASQPVSGDGGVVYRTFILEAPVRQTSGSQYTFAFANASTGLSVRVYVNSYADGRCSQNGSYDCRFHTYVITSDWSELAYRDMSFTTASNVISNAAQLAQFAYLVNGGAQYFGSTITLANDINLAGHFWTPICTDGSFAGTFDGNGRTIRCVIANRPEMNLQGLFGYTGGTVQNVNVADADIAGLDFVGGLIGSGLGNVVNCSVSGVVTGRFGVAGVVGYESGSTVESCVNQSRVNGLGYVGGVVGQSSSTPLVGCRNEGDVSGGANQIGGVVGLSNGNILECVNTGPVTSDPSAWYIGGVAGSTTGESSLIRNCLNSGNVSGGTQVGGIIGWNWSQVDRCANTGGVSGGTEVGGIAGMLYQCTARDCANQGAIEATGTAGGLAGGQDGVMINSVNTGSVTGGEYAGGLTGMGYSGHQSINCQNNGAVGGSSLAGALAAWGGVFSNCYWKQTGTVPFDLPAKGDASTTLRDCRAFGNAPGTLAAPVTVGSVNTDRLSAALNAWVSATWTPGCGLCSWTAGTTTNYPFHALAIQVGGKVIPQTLSDGFMSGVSGGQINATVAVYTNEHPRATAESFGSLLSDADAMGFTYAELGVDGDILDFNPSLAITVFDPLAWSLTFSVANGIDATPVAAMNRLAASQAGLLRVLQSDQPGGTTTPLNPAVMFHGDGTAQATFTLPAPPASAFFRLTLEHQP